MLIYNTLDIAHMGADIMRSTANERKIRNKAREDGKLLRGGTILVMAIATGIAGAIMCYIALMG